MDILTSISLKQTSHPLSSELAQSEAEARGTAAQGLLPQDSHEISQFLSPDFAHFAAHQLM
jgi:hypothetical protein